MNKDEWDLKNGACYIPSSNINGKKVKTKLYIPKEAIEECMAKHMTYKDMEEYFGCSSYAIMNIATKQYGLRSKARQYQQKINNVSKKKEVREKISDSVKDRWAEGFYEDRVNGMLGMTMAQHPNYKRDIPEREYRKKALFYHKDLVCPICGKPIDPDEKFDVHHIDEDRNNSLLTNLEVVHVPCHQKLHLEHFKMPYVSVTKCFEFEAAHFIPGHYADCKYVHGHSYKLEITVKQRINPITGMSLDFKKLSEAVKNNVIEVLDHGFINDWMTRPTAENMCYWIWDVLSIDVKGMQKIRVWETSSSYAEITKDDVWELVHSCEAEADWLDEDKVISHKKFIEEQHNRMKEE